MRIIYSIPNRYAHIYIKRSGYNSNVYYIMDEFNTYDVVWRIHKSLGFRIVKLRKI